MEILKQSSGDQRNRTFAYTAYLVGLSRLSPSDIHLINVDLLENNIAYSDSRYIVPKKKKVKKPDYPPALAGSVKDMPVYDPDAEILSLAFTIPSWIRSIERTRTAAKLIEVSSNARHRLEEELIALGSVVDIMLLAIKEERDP